MMLVVLWLVPSAIFLCTLTFGWQTTWQAAGVPSFEPPFLDLHVITSGLTTLQRGGDPLVANPADPLGRTLNYPRIWLFLFSVLGVTDKNVAFAGVAVCAVYLTCISGLILRSTGDLEALVIVTAGLSLAALYGIERGNIDLLIFALVYFGCVAGNGRLRSVLLGVAGALKIYPTAALVADVVQKPLKQRVWPACLTLLVIAILGAQWRDIDLIRRSTPVSAVQSFGILSIKALAMSYAGRFSLPPASGTIVMLLCFLIAVLVVGIAWYRPTGLSQIIRDAQPQGEMFAVFGAIYAFCFAVGSNWDYRLIFLIPTLPLACRLVSRSVQRNWAILYIVAVIFCENSYILRMKFGMVMIHFGFFVVFLLVLAVLTQQFGGRSLRGNPRFRDRLGSYSFAVDGSWKD